MNELVKEKLSEDYHSLEILSLNLLYLKYRKIQDTKKPYDIEYQKWFCYDHCYDNEIKEINAHYNSLIDVVNPFNSVVIDNLINKGLIDISKYDNCKYDISISKNGIDFLKSYYKIQGPDLTQMIIYQSVNITNINISNTVNNITNGLNQSDKDFLIESLKEYGKGGNKNRFIDSLKKLPSDILSKIIVDFLGDPNKLLNLFEHLNK